MIIIRGEREGLLLWLLMCIIYHYKMRPDTRNQ
nr:MAG TPA: hypothetical protein [Caudoviricetes sp.]